MVEGDTNTHFEYAHLTHHLLLFLYFCTNGYPEQKYPGSAATATPSHADSLAAIKENRRGVEN